MAEPRLTRGCVVRHRRTNELFYAAPLGTTVKLYNDAACQQFVRYAARTSVIVTALTTIAPPAVVVPVVLAVAPPPTPPPMLAAAAGIVVPALPLLPPITPRLATMPTHFYVFHDFAWTSNTRFKIGITSDLHQRLRAYLTSSPDGVFVVRATFATREPALTFEARFKHHFAANRVAASEVFDGVPISTIRTYLHQRGLRASPRDLVYYPV